MNSVRRSLLNTLVFAFSLIPLLGSVVMGQALQGPGRASEIRLQAAEASQD
jgi:hypothetical protein